MERDFLIEVYEAQEPEENESLSHHGVNGMHWGVRRYQNKDGSLTPEGRRHLGIGDKIRSAKESIEKHHKQKKQAVLREKKNSILARGDVNEILKNKHLFTTNELDKAISRTQRMSMLESMTPEKAAQRKKEAEAQAKAARGKEAVDRMLYRAGQLVQMAPAMIQCYAIVRGLLGHGGSAPNPSGGSHVSTGGGHNQNSSHTSSNSSSSGSHATVDQAISTATYNNNKYKIKPNNQAVIYSTSTEGIDTTSLPSWSNPTTNAVFTDCMHTAETVSINSLVNSTLFSDNAGASMYSPAGAASDSSYDLDFD